MVVAWWWDKPDEQGQVSAKLLDPGWMGMSWHVQASSALSFARSFIVPGSVFRDGRDSLRGWVDGWMVPRVGYRIVTCLSCFDLVEVERGGDYYVSFWHKDLRM